MLFALPLLAAFILAGFVSGMPLAGTFNTTLASRADYHGSVINNSTDLAARFVHSSTPPVCSKANIFCMTKVSMSSARVRRHLTRSSHFVPPDTRLARMPSSWDPIIHSGGHRFSESFTMTEIGLR